MLVPLFWIINVLLTYYHRKNEVVTPHQTTLLKLVDSYLQSTQLNSTTIQIPNILRTHESLGSFLARRFFTLSEYAQAAIHKSLGMTPAPKPNSKAKQEEETISRTSTESWSSSSHPRKGSTSSSESLAEGSSIAPTSLLAAMASLQELDVMLPKVCEALVLITQCIITTCLEAEEQQARLDEGISTFVTFTNLKTYFNQKRRDGKGVVEVLIGMHSFLCKEKERCHLSWFLRYHTCRSRALELLSLLDVFLPRINFGKPVNADGTPSTAATAQSQNGAGATPGNADGAGFSYLKRDLVRLLGVLCHGVQAVQDRVRDAGGLPVVMNLCVIDERNPCELTL